MPRSPKTKPKSADPERELRPESSPTSVEKGSYYYDDAYGYEDYVPDVDEDENSMIFTVGHSTRDLADFISLLIDNGVQAIADVRSLPGSRRYPHFNAESLGLSLAAAGIDYVLIKELGGRRKSRPDSKNTVWRHKAFRGYADHMETDEFKRGIEQLLELSGKKRTAIMCAEAVWWRCHRSMIADYLKSCGTVVEHIIDGTTTQTHPYTSAASICDGKLVYGEGPESA
jgi:uncharacterized protein (DUF488 family)